MNAPRVPLLADRTGEPHATSGHAVKPNDKCPRCTGRCAAAADRLPKNLVLSLASVQALDAIALLVTGALTPDDH